MTAAQLYKIATSDNPKDAILKSVGDLGKINLFSGRVLVAIYIAPEKTAGGIFRPQSNIKEDIYQGVVGLVLKKGNMAFVSDATHDFHDQDVHVGEWVTFRPGDAKRIQINGVDCRIVEDTLIDMVINDPEMITHKQ